jgi:hypothetical protein
MKFQRMKFGIFVLSMILLLGNSLSSKNGKASLFCGDNEQIALNVNTGISYTNDTLDLPGINKKLKYEE